MDPERACTPTVLLRHLNHCMQMPMWESINGSFLKVRTHMTFCGSSAAFALLDATCGFALA